MIFFNWSGIDLQDGKKRVASCRIYFTSGAARFLPDCAPHTLLHLRPYLITSWILLFMYNCVFYCNFLIYSILCSWIAVENNKYKFQWMYHLFMFNYSKAKQKDVTCLWHISFSRLITANQDGKMLRVFWHILANLVRTEFDRPNRI